MCHFTYLLFVCCGEPKEHDGIDLLDVEYCNECPVSSEGYLYDDDFFHCPNATGECLGDSDLRCPECKQAYVMEDNNDDLNKDKEPDDDFSDHSDAESESNWYPIGMYDVPWCGGHFLLFSDLLGDLPTVHELILTMDMVHRL